MKRGNVVIVEIRYVERQGGKRKTNPKLLNKGEVLCPIKTNAIFNTLKAPPCGSCTTASRTGSTRIRSDSSQSASQDNGMFCIALTNPTEVVITNKNGSYYAEVDPLRALRVTTTPDSRVVLVLGCGQRGRESLILISFPSLLHIPFFLYFPSSSPVWTGTTGPSTTARSRNLQFS